MTGGVWPDDSPDFFTCEEGVNRAGAHDPTRIKAEAPRGRSGSFGTLPPLTLRLGWPKRRNRWRHLKFWQILRRQPKDRRILVRIRVFLRLCVAPGIEARIAPVQRPHPRLRRNRAHFGRLGSMSTSPAGFTLTEIAHITWFRSNGSTSSFTTMMTHPGPRLLGG
jgi:hypothetical protein